MIDHRILRRIGLPALRAYALFWSWNVIFLAFMLLGFAPNVLPEMRNAIRTDMIPPAFLIYALLLISIPAVAIVLGMTLFRAAPGRLLALGYGIEGPLILLIAIRFFVVRELTLPVAMLLLVAGLGMVTLLWHLIDRRLDERGSHLLLLRLIGATLLLSIGLYASVWLVFYAFPFSVEVIRRVASTVVNLSNLLTSLWDALGTLSRSDLLWMPFWALGAILPGYSATLFIGLPLALPFFYGRAWWHAARAMGRRHGMGWALLVTFLVLSIAGGMFARSNAQPQEAAFMLLAEPPTSRAESEALVAQEELIRAGLLNAYLAPLRYVSAAGEVLHIRQMYESTFDMPHEEARRVQRWYESLVRPLLYQPIGMEDLEGAGSGALGIEPLAAELYRAYFDRPITEGEHEAVVKAARSTWSAEQAMRAWQAVDDREMYLEAQEVPVTEHGDWADVELYEVYQNQTGMRQEIIYYFSLPESAVITGVWLGTTPDRSSRFPYRISPRGAAQALYRNEVRRNVGPALVEQIGPRQYRLRIFPVEPVQWQWDTETGRSVLGEAPRLYMWLTWRVLISPDNTWALPRLAELRNVYWNEETSRLVNGGGLADAGET